MATPEHENPIEALGPRCAHKAFRERVRPRRADGGFDDFGTFRLEDVVETGGELPIPVADEELHWTLCLSQVADQVPGDLGDKAVVRVFGYPEEVSRWVACSMANKTWLNYGRPSLAKKSYGMVVGTTSTWTTYLNKEAMHLLARARYHTLNATETVTVSDGATVRKQITLVG